MGIKQLGGVFGRNPTFNDVTIEGQLTFDGDIDINSDLKIDGDLDVTGNSDLTGALTVRSKQTMVTSDLVFDNAYGVKGKLVAGTEVGMIRRNASDQVAIDEDGYGAKIGFGGRYDFAGAGDFTVGIGNVVIGTSGKGIDFSATAGTGTSELLDDYEEGTWTPVLTFATAGDVSVTYGQQTGTYVKIGKLVVLKCRVTTSAFSHSTASGALRITGLPFSATNRTLNPIAFNGITKANYTTISSQIDTGSSISTFIASGSGQSQGSVLASDVPTGGSPILQFVIAYEN